MKTMVEAERISSEKKFHNQLYQTSGRKKLDRFYITARLYYREYERILHRHCSSGEVLEYGCGIGSYSFPLAQWGAKVTGIDISESAIELSETQAKQLNVSDRTTYMVMNAEAMSFPDRSFGLVCGTGILHHLELDKALIELKRVMADKSVAVFCEPMGYHPAVVLFRKLTPKLRTADEHPLVLRDFKLMRTHFKDVQLKWYCLTAPIAALFPKPLMKIMLPLFEGLDRIIFLFPPLRLFAWHVLITLRK